MIQMSPRTDRNITAVLVIAMATLFALLYRLTPLQLDDYMFLSVYRDVTGGFDFSFKGLWDYAMSIRMEDNCRFSNVMAAVFGGMEPWHTLFPYLAGILTASLPLFILRFVGIRRNRCVGYALVWAAMVVFLPWRNSLLVMDYALNYIFAAFVTFAFVGAMFRGYSRGFTPAWYVLTLLLAILAGGWHEGFALPTFGGLVVLFFTPSPLGRAGVGPLVLYLLVAVVVMLCPGMLNRTLRETGEANPVVAVKVVADLALVIVACVMVAGMLLWRRTREEALVTVRSRSFIVFGTAMVLSAALSLVVKHTPRTAFYPELCAIIVVGLLIRPWILRLSRRIALYIICVTAALLMAHGVHAAMWQYRYYEEDKRIMAAYDESETGTVFYDIIMPTEVPVTTLYFPSRTSQIVSFHFFCIDQLWPDKYHAVVPTELRDLTGSRLVTAYPDSVFAKGNSLWMRDLPDFYKPTMAYADIMLRDGRRLPYHPMSVQRFVPSPGDTLVYLLPEKLTAPEIADISIVSYLTKSELDSLNRYLTAQQQ